MIATRLLLFVTVLGLSNALFADEEPIGRRVFRTVELSCDTKYAYHQYHDSKTRIGHLVKLSFPASDRELVADTAVFDPENPERKLNVAGVIEEMTWDGDANDPISICFCLSPQNKALFQEALTLMPRKTEVEAEWVVYDYDYQTGKYFKRFYTEKKPLKFFITENHTIYFREDPDRDTTNPVNFRMGMDLTPRKDVGTQEVTYSFSHNGTKFTQQIGKEERVEAIFLTVDKN